ncbi:hypothetical protein ACROYT_G033834 [Oculina patagonica]
MFARFSRCMSKANALRSRRLVVVRAISSNAHFFWRNRESRRCSDRKRSKYLRSFSTYYQERCLYDTKRKKGDNVILMGSPGAGKTSVGRILGSRLGKEVIDVDDDVLENVWGMTVAEKLSQVGSDGFVEVEGQALLQFCPTDAVISLSGSNPMHKEAMDHVKSLGTVVYLDVEDDEILNRLAAMKVNRIVGQNEGISMSEILQYRKQFYESSYDVRVVCTKGDSIEEIANKTQERLKELRRDKGFTSTRQEYSDSSKESPGFLDVVLEGLAPDGGLYVPKRKIPHSTQGQWERLVDCSYQERALRILETWISPTYLHPTILRGMISSAYSDNFQHETIAPVVKLNDQFYIQELFYGPTASFKDMALQLTPQFFNEAIYQKSASDGLSKRLILVATSGDTGSAVLEGFKDVTNTSVLVLYPVEGVSLIQKAQMVSTDSPNTCVIGVNSDFDFCQTTIKTLFNDKSFNKKLADSYNVQLSAANSLNWGRLLPQVVYHASAYLDLVKSGVISMGEKTDLCVPTGNFGNILAAYYAKEMGVPFNNLICASNENNILTDFFHTGLYDMSKRHIHQTISPSIDILKSSNLERLLYHVTGNNGQVVASLMRSLEENKYFKISDDLRGKLSTVFKADWTTQDTCLNTIRSTFEQMDYVLDTHTAVAKDVANRFANPNRPLIISATAHYSKFAHDVLKGLRKFPTKHDPVELFESLRKVATRPAAHKRLESSVSRPQVQETVCKAADVRTVMN